MAYNVVGFESLTISNSAVALTRPMTARSFLGKLETAAVRVRGDGTAPTTTVGVLVSVGEVIILDDSELDRAQFIRQSGSDGTLQGHYYSAGADVVRRMVG